MEAAHNFDVLVHGSIGDKAATTTEFLPDEGVKASSCRVLVTDVEDVPVSTDKRREKVAVDGT